ncbi:IclR family transcriptional regulator [Planococcus beigongshangi]|uniref:IclR family transcriptional regulator n=1 Tax=Planococcus beigongshangi TaxID=2782536 RepID=UPI00193AFAAE|nr:IclR family transcriptional regulator [Planococcus beigongshangi]
MSSVQSVERAFTLLESLSESPDGMQISRLSEIAGLSKSTVHRLLATLINLGYVQKDAVTEKYRVSYKIVSLAQNLLNNVNIIPIAKPFLEELSKEVNETIHLCIEDSGDVLYIDKIETKQTIRMFSRIGSRAPYYCTGVGKIFLSGKTAHSYERAIENTDFTPKTENTITSKLQLDEEIERVKKYGYALDNIENEDGIRCIAAPIKDAKGNIIASFSISGPSSRITMELIESELIEKIANTSKEISKQLGY